MKQKKGVQNGGVVKKQNPAVAVNSKNTKLLKNKSKKTEKTPPKIVPPKKIEEEEDESEMDSEDDSGADLAADVIGEKNVSDGEDNQETGDEDDDDDDDGEDDDDDEDQDESDEVSAKGLLDNEAEEENDHEGEGEDDEDEDDDDEDEDDDDDDNDTENSDAAGESDDEVPTEAPIKKSSEPLVAKKSKQEAKVEQSSQNSTKIKTGPLGKRVPIEQVIVVKNLPKHFKQAEIVEVFAKYGTLHTIHPLHGPENSIAYIAYTTPEAAQKAVAATNDTVKIKGTTVSVSLQHSNAKEQKDEGIKKKNTPETQSRTVHIKSLRLKTTEAQVREHFKECGVIENVGIFENKSYAYGFIRFAKEESVSAAKKLHNSVLNNSNIWVLLPSEQSYKALEKDPKRTISIKNTQNLESFPANKLREIFSKCGEIEDLNMLSKRNVLAFVTFKNEKSVKKALKLSGTNVQGLDLEIQEYKIKVPKQKTQIYVQNIKTDATEEELRELFSTAGEIENIYKSHNFAIIRFQDTDGFCKSFLLNESLLQGQMIFIEPYSDKKQAVLKSNKKLQGNKRPYPNPYKKGGPTKRFKPN